MTYEVTLGKWRAAALLASGLCLAGLVFLSGLLVGVGLWQPTRAEIALAQEHRRRQESSATAAPVPLAAAPAAVPAAAPAAAAPPPAPVQSAVAASAPQSPVQQAEPAPSAIEESPFVLQVGSFRDAKNAQLLQAELKGKGYPATIFNALDEGHRMWHVVRVGRYSDVASAAREAARLSEQRVHALIRRGDRL